MEVIEVREHLKLAIPVQKLKSGGVQVLKEGVTPSIPVTSPVPGPDSQRRSHYDTGVPKEWKFGTKEQIQRFLGEPLMSGCSPETSIFQGNANQLGGPISAILDLKKWKVDLTPNLEKELEPALKLTTHFIKSDYTSFFWRALVSNRKEISPGSDTYELDDTVLNNDKSKKLLSQRMGSETKTGVEGLTFRFADIAAYDAEPFTGGWRYSRTIAGRAPHRPGTGADLRKEWNKYTYEILLHKDLLGALRSIARLSGEWKNQNLRKSFTFFLTSLLLREIAYVQDHQWALRNFESRPEIASNGQHTSWRGSRVRVQEEIQIRLFGGIIVPISRRCDTLHGLAIMPWHDDRKDFDESLHAIPMLYILHVQARPAWAEQLEQPRIETKRYRVTILDKSERPDQWSKGIPDEEFDDYIPANT